MTTTLPHVRRALIHLAAIAVTLAVAQMVASAQIPDVEGCGTTTTIPDPPIGPAPLNDPNLDTRGYRIPSGFPNIANLKALILFIDFSDEADDVNNPVWPADGTGPRSDMRADIIDPTLETWSGKKHNVTTYFRDQSSGQLNIYGNTVYKRARYSWARYKDPTPISQAEALAAGHSEDAGEAFNTDPEGWAFKHILEDLDATQPTGPSFFGAYDSWETPASNNTPYYQCRYNPDGDGFVDLIVACYRSTLGCPMPNVAGFASLPSGTFVRRNNDPAGVKSMAINPSCGVTVNRMRLYPKWHMIAHEIGHALGLGTPAHQYGSGVWSILSHYGEATNQRNVVMNAVEKERLGWLSISDVFLQGPTPMPDGAIATLRDYNTYGDAIRIYLPAPNPTNPNDPNYVDRKECFILENHQRFEPGATGFLPGFIPPYVKSLPAPGQYPGYDPADDYLTYDVVDRTAGNRGKGLYILQFEPPSAGDLRIQENTMKVLTADGRWRWNNGGTDLYPWSETQTGTIWERKEVDRSTRFEGPGTGTYFKNRSDRDFLSSNPPSGAPWLPQYIWRDPQTDAITKDGAGKSVGDGKDAWHEYEIFSPWSNPNSDRSHAQYWSNTNVPLNTPIGVEVLPTLAGQDPTVVRVKLYTNHVPGTIFPSAILGPPSKVQDVKVRTNDFQTAHISWQPNVEPDLFGYAIYRTNDGTPLLNPQLVGTVGITATDFFDTPPPPPPGHQRYEYYVLAIDNQAQRSAQSEIGFMDYYAPKRNVAASSLTGTTRLEGNVPNPFTASTDVRYEIAHDGEVTLKLFDVMGREVRTLFAGTQAAGAYTMTIDGASLRSGTYICSLSTGGTSHAITIVRVD